MQAVRDIGVIRGKSASACNGIVLKMAWGRQAARGKQRTQRASRPLVF